MYMYFLKWGRSGLSDFQLSQISGYHSNFFLVFFYYFLILLIIHRIRFLYIYKKKFVFFFFILLLFFFLNPTEGVYIIISQQEMNIYNVEDKHGIIYSYLQG